MPEDPVINFIESLPVQGMSLGNKVIIFTSVIAVLLAVIMTWISSRRKGYSGSNGTGTQRMKYATLKNEDDRTIAIKIELDALYIALENTEEAYNRGKLTSSSYYKLIKLYDTEIKVLENKLNELGESFDESEFAEEEEVKEVVTEFEEITQQVPKRKVDVKDLDPFAPKVQTPPVIPPVTAQKTPEVQQTQTPSKPTIPPPPGAKPTIPPPPGAKPSIPPPPGAKPTIPPPPGAKPSIPAPPMAKPAAIPSPQKPEQINSSSPFEAQNPLQNANAGEEKDKFAQSTSIAALRSDMLRELARLRKYIDEGEDE